MKLKEFILMRHSYDDHSYIDGENNTSLTSDGIKIAKTAAKQILMHFDDRKIIVRTSTKKRALETAEIVCSEMLKNNMCAELIEDKCLNELYQGKFNFNSLSHEDRVNFLQSCWDDFEWNRENDNLFHRFGEYKSKDIVLMPGENHSQWSKRIGNGVLNILNDMAQNNQVLGVTHRGATFEIQNIIKMANGEIKSDAVEHYKTVYMKYCQETMIDVCDINDAQKRITEFINERGTE